MSTTSSISLAQEDGTIQQVYVNWDGYVTHNGVILFNYYQEIDKIKELMSLGDLSYLSKEISPKSNHSFDKPEEGVSIFYARDRGEKKVNAKKFTNIQEFMRKGNFQNYDYIYREKSKKWYIIDHQNNKFKALKGIIKKELKTLKPQYKKDFLELVEKQKEERNTLNDVKLNKPKF